MEWNPNEWNPAVDMTDPDAVRKERRRIAQRKWREKVREEKEKENGLGKGGKSWQNFSPKAGSGSGGAVNGTGTGTEAGSGAGNGAGNGTMKGNVDRWEPAESGPSSKGPTVTLHASMSATAPVPGAAPAAAKTSDSISAAGTQSISTSASASSAHPKYRPKGYDWEAMDRERTKGQALLSSLASQAKSKSVSAERSVSAESALTEEDELDENAGKKGKGKGKEKEKDGEKDKDAEKDKPWRHPDEVRWYGSKMVPFSALQADSAHLPSSWVSLPQFTPAPNAGPNTTPAQELSLGGWTPDTIVWYLLTTAFSIPPRDSNAFMNYTYVVPLFPGFLDTAKSDAVVARGATGLGLGEHPNIFAGGGKDEDAMDVDERKQGEPICLPRGYRLPMMFLARFMWESLRLFLQAKGAGSVSPNTTHEGGSTSTTITPLEWDDNIFEVLHVARVIRIFLEDAKKAKDEGEERVRALTAAGALSSVKKPALPSSASASAAGSPAPGPSTSTAANANASTSTTASTPFQVPWLTHTKLRRTTAASPLTLAHTLGIGLTGAGGIGAGAGTDYKGRVQTGEYDKTWRCARMDRMLTRVKERWLVPREWSVRGFWVDWGEEEYEVDVLRHDWTRFATKGAKGFKLTKEEISSGISAHELLKGFGKEKETGRWVWRGPGAGTKPGGVGADEEDDEDGGKKGKGGKRVKGAKKGKGKVKEEELEDEGVGKEEVGVDMSGLEPASEMTLEPTPAILDLFKRITHPPVTLGDEPSDILDVVMADPEVKDHDEAAEKEKEKDRKEKERKEEEEAKKKKPVVIAQPFTVPLTPSSSSASVKKSPEKAKEKEKEKSPVKMTISVPPRPRPIIPTTVTVSAGPTQPATKPVESSSATTPASKGTTIVTSLSGGTSNGVPVALPPAKGRMAKFWESTFSKPGARPASASAAPSTSSSAPATPSVSVSTPAATPSAVPEKAASAQSDTGPASVAARSPPQPSAPTSATTPNHTEQTGAPSSSAASTPAASGRTPVISNYAVCHHPNACHLPSARLRIFPNYSSGRGVHVANHHKSPCGCPGDPLSMILDAAPMDFIAAAFHLYTQAQSEKRKDLVIQKYKHAWNLCFPNRPAPFSGSAPFNFSQTQDFSEYGSLPANTRWVKPFVGDPSVSSIYSVPAASKHRSAVSVSFAPSYEEFFVDAATIAPRTSLALSSAQSGDGESSISAPSSSKAQLPALADTGSTATSGSGTNTPKVTTSDKKDENSLSTDKGTTSGSSKSSAFETIQTAISGNRLQGPVEKVTPAKRSFEGDAAGAEKSENDKGETKETEKKADEDERAAKKAKVGGDADKDEKEDEDEDDEEDEEPEHRPRFYQVARKTASVKPDLQAWRAWMLSNRIRAQPSSSESESEEEEDSEEELDSGDNYRPSKSVAAATAAASKSATKTSKSKDEGKGKGTGSGSASAPTGFPYKTAQKTANLALKYRNQSGRSTVVPAGLHENAKKRKKDGVESPVRESASASNGDGMMSPAKKQKRLSGAGDGKEKQKEMEKMSGKTPLLTSTSTASTTTTTSASDPTRRERLLLPAQGSTLYAAMSLVASAAVSASVSTPKSMPTTTATTVQARTAAAAAAAASPIGNVQQPMISHQDKGTTANLPRAAQGPAQSQSRSSEVELPQQKAKEAEASRGGPSPMVVDKPTTTPSSAVPAARAAPSTAVPPKAPTSVQAQAPAEAQAAVQAVQEMGPYISELATRFYRMVKPNATPGEVAHAPDVLMEVLKVVNPQQATQLQLLGLQSSQPSQPQAQAQPQTPRPASAPRSPMLMSQQQASLPPQKRKGLYVPVVPSGNGGIIGASPSGLSLSATPPSGAVSGQPASPRFTHMDADISPSSSSPQSSFNTNGSTVAGAPGTVVKSPPGALVPRPASAPGARRLNETTPSILLQSLSGSDKMKSLHTVYLMRDLLRFLTEDIVHPPEKKEGQQTPPPEATQDGAENVNGTTPTPEAALDGMTMDDRLNVMASTTVALGNVIFHHRGAELERRVRDIDRLFEMHAVHLGGARGVFEGSSKDQQGEEGAEKGKGYGWLKISPTAVSEVRRMLEELQGGHDESGIPALEPMIVDDSVRRDNAMDVDMDGAKSDVPDLVHGLYEGAIGSVNDSIVEEDFVDLDLQNLSPPQNDDDIASTPPASPRLKTIELTNNVVSDGSASTFTLAEVQKIKAQMEEERKRYEEELAHLRSTLSQLQEERMNQPVNGPRASQADTPGSIAELELLALNARMHALETVPPGEENKPSSAMAAVEEFVRSQALITSRPSSPPPIASPQSASTPAPLTPPPTAPMQAQQGLVAPFLSSHPLYHLLVGAGGDADSDLGLHSLSDDLVPSHPSRYPPRENQVAQQQNGAPSAPSARLPTSVPGPALSVHGPGIIASRSPSVPEVPVVIPGLGNAASPPVTPPTMPSISPSSSLGIASPIQAQGTGAGLTPNSASPPKASNSVADRSFPPRSKRKFEKVYGL